MGPTFPQIILLGVVQGAAELLPVSSSAHVIAAEKLMHLDPSSPSMAFLLVMLHTGTMAAVIVYFAGAWKKRFFSSAERFGKAVRGAVVATVATGIVGLVLKEIIEKSILRGHPGGAEVEDLFASLPLIAAALAAAGVLIVVAGLGAGKKAPAHPELEEVPLPAAGWIGAVQGLALPFRGFSRSGSTISTGLLLGVPRRAAEEFSFALAVILTPPVIAREFLRYRHAAGTVNLGLLAPGLVGMACSFVAGLLALRWLSGWLSSGKWHYFGIYCFLAAAGVAVLAARGY